MADTTADKMRREYLNRINIVLDYIEANLCEDISLDALARVSGFSKFHFHRIFSAVMKETLYQYITRQRLEKARSFLCHAPENAITAIAYQFGFTDSAMFARLFKKHYGMSATALKKQVSKNQKASVLFPVYDDKNEWRETKMDFIKGVETKCIPELSVIYLRHIGTYASLGKVFQKMIRQLFVWAMAHEAVRSGESMLLAVYHDHPDITEDAKRRVSIGLTVSEDIKPDGAFGKMTIPSGRYAVGHFEISHEEAAKQQQAAWQYLFGAWLPESGYQPDDRAVFEVYTNNPMEHPEKKHLIDIYLPIKPL